jgi:sec-independent protein translocase protein TatA
MPEWWVVLGVAVLLFGAKKLPELARSLGRAQSEFKQGMRDGTSPEQPAAEQKPEAKGPEA